MIFITRFREPRMRRAFGSQLLVLAYHRAPFASLFLKLYTRLEGGQMYSLTLRDVLARYFGVAVGEFSYGSLLVPGFADTGTSIGRYVSVGPNVRRIGAAHPLHSPSLHPFWYNPALGLVDATSDVARTGCSLGHDSWIGANAVILPGCSSIGIGAVVGAGAVVTKNVPNFAIVAGNPAREIGTRFSNEVGAALIQSSPWLLSPLEAQNVLRELALTRLLDSDESHREATGGS